MLKGTVFSGQPVFTQLAGMISRSSFETLVKENQAGHYCKGCKSWEHLMCMLYCIMNNCSSLREVTHGIAAYGGKLNHLGINYTPPRSTLSDANAHRSEAFFGAVYDKLYKRYKEVLSDSHLDNQLLKRVYLIDSTTISLFKAIMKCVGRKPIDGKSKGGIKVHTMLNAYEQVPQLIHFTDAATHDHTFLSKLNLHSPIRSQSLTVHTLIISNTLNGRGSRCTLLPGLSTMRFMTGWKKQKYRTTHLPGI